MNATALLQQKKEAAKTLLKEKKDIVKEKAAVKISKVKKVVLSGE